MQERPKANSVPTSLQEWLSGLKSAWALLLLPLAAWGTSLYIGFIGTPPPNDDGMPEDLTVTARIVIASFFVIWGSLALAFSRRHNLWLWRSLLIIALILTLVGWYEYRYAKQEYICAVDDKSYVIGNSGTYSDLARTYISEARKTGRVDSIDCEELIRASIHHPNNVWAQSAIDRNRRILTVLFLALMPLFVLTLSSAFQILICHNQPDPSAYFSGDWQDDWTPKQIPDVAITLSFIDAKPLGKITFNFLTETWKEKNITPMNARFRGSSLHIQLERPFNCVMRVSTDGRTAILVSDDQTRYWELTKTPETNPNQEL